MKTLGCAQPLLPLLVVEGRGGLCHIEGLSPEVRAGLAARCDPDAHFCWSSPRMSGDHFTETAISREAPFLMCWLHTYESLKFLFLWKLS